MNEHKIEKEIIRVEKAIAKTKSPFLKRDYEKYLKRLKKQLEEAKAGA